MHRALWISTALSIIALIKVITVKKGWGFCGWNKNTLAWAHWRLQHSRGEREQVAGNRTFFGFFIHQWKFRTWKNDKNFHRTPSGLFSQSCNVSPTRHDVMKLLFTVKSISQVSLLLLLCRRNCQKLNCQRNLPLRASANFECFVYFAVISENERCPRHC